MMRQTRRRLTVTPDLPGDALILREPYRPLLAACADAAAVAPDIKVLEGRVVSGDQFVSPAEQIMLGPRRAGPFPKRSVEPKC